MDTRYRDPEYPRKYAEAHREEQRAWKRAYYAKNREALQAKQRERYKRDAEKRRARQREYGAANRIEIGLRLKERKYGIPREELQRMLDAQQGGCAICGTVGKRLTVDHDHASGRVRGLLCESCNFGIGKFYDNADWLRRAAWYIEASQ
jgi:hypothetical protein